MTSQHATSSSQSSFWEKFKKPISPQPTTHKSPIPELNFLGTAAITASMCEASTSLTCQDLVCLAHAIIKDANQHLADVNKTIAGLDGAEHLYSDLILNYAFN